MLDAVAVVFLIFALASIPLSLLLMWQQKELSKFSRVFFGVLFGAMAGVLLWCLAISLVFRDGMGP